MNEFEAKSPRQLDLCLRMLYAENVQFSVRIKENDKGKLMYVIGVKVDEHEYIKLREKYRILIS